MKIMTLGDVRDALLRVRSSSHLCPPPKKKLNVRPILAIVTLGYMRRQNEIGGWSPGAAAMAWRTPSRGRRNLMIDALDALFGFPTPLLLRGGTQPALPSHCSLDPLSGLPPKPRATADARVIWQDGTPWYNATVGIDSAWWWWATGEPELVGRVEFNPSNTINTQQGVECFFPLSGLSRDNAIRALAVRRPSCEHFRGTPGEGRCGIAPSSEGCMAAKKKVAWPRVVMTDPTDPTRWGIAPNGFEALRAHVGTSGFGELRGDLSVLAGACKALREGQDFGNGTIVVDDGWFASQLSPDSWEALRT